MVYFKTRPEVWNSIHPYFERSIDKPTHCHHMNHEGVSAMEDLKTYLKAKLEKAASVFTDLKDDGEFHQKAIEEYHIIRNKMENMDDYYTEPRLSDDGVVSLLAGIFVKVILEEVMRNLTYRLKRKEGKVLDDIIQIIHEDRFVETLVHYAVLKEGTSEGK